MKQTRSLLIVILFSLLVFAPGITRIPLIDHDSAVFAQASKQMAERQSPWQTKIQDKTQNNKQPGVHWLQASAVKWLSPNHLNAPWPYRLPSLLGALLAVLLTFAFAKKYFTLRTATISALLLASSILLIVEAHLATTAAMLLGIIVLMQGALWRLYQPPSADQNNLPWLLTFWGAMAAGIFISPVAPIFAFATIAFLCSWDRSWHCLKIIKLPFGLLFLFAIIAVWMHAFNLSFHARDFFPKFTHSIPPGFYFILLPLTLWPGVLFFWHGAIHAWQQRSQPAIRFCIAWIVPSWILFALTPIKLPQMLLPVYPAIVMLIAHAIEHFDTASSPRWGRFLMSFMTIVWAVVSFGLIWLMVLVPYYLTREVCIAHTLISSALMILTGIILQYKAHKPMRSVLLMSLASFLLLAPTLQFRVPQLKALWLSHQVSEIIHSRMPHAISEQNPLITTLNPEASLQFELGPDKLKFRPIALAGNQFKTDKPQLYLLPYKHLERLKAAAEHAHLKWQPLAKLSGVYYSKGKLLELSLVRIG